MRRTVLSSVIFCAFSILVSNVPIAYSNEIPLGTVNLAWGGGIINSVFNSPALKFAWETPSQAEMNCGVFTSIDVGRTVSMSTEITGFNAISSLLTNRTNDQLMMLSLLTWNGMPGYEPGIGDGVLDSQWLKFVSSTYVDFYGYNITRIDLTINRLDIWVVDSYYDPITCILQPTSTNFSYDVTYTIYGVPEPCTLVLLGLGGLMLRRRKK